MSVGGEIIRACYTRVLHMLNGLSVGETVEPSSVNSSGMEIQLMLSWERYTAVNITCADTRGRFIEAAVSHIESRAWNESRWTSVEYKDKLLTTSVKPPAGFYGKGAVVDFRIPASYSGPRGTEQLFENNLQLFYGLLTIKCRSAEETSSVCIFCWYLKWWGHLLWKTKK